MAKGVRETMARIRTLLTTTVGLQRALSTTLTDWTDLAMVDRRATAEQVGRAFVLEHVGSEEDEDSTIIGDYTRWELMRLTVSIFAGLGVDAGTDNDYGGAQQLLGEIDEEVRDLLEDPNNASRSTTGWWWATTWRGVSSEAPVNGRLTRTITFRCLVEHEPGAL